MWGELDLLTESSILLSSPQGVRPARISTHEENSRTFFAALHGCLWLPFTPAEADPIALGVWGVTWTFYGSLPCDRH